MSANFSPLHPAQQDVYMDQLLHTQNSGYNIGGYIIIRGNLNKKLLHKAVTTAPQVFDAFKMRFDFEATDFLCYYDDAYVEMELGEVDVSNEINPEEKAKEWVQKRFNVPFELTKNSILFEQFLIKVSENEHWLLGKYFHLITDGLGFIALLQHIAKKYSSLLANDQKVFNYPWYRDAAINANEYLHSENYTEDGDYWKNKINNTEEKPLQKKHILKNQEGSSSTYNFDLSDARRRLFEEVQLKTKFGLQQLTLAALIIYFGKASGFTEFIFGIPIHKRNSRQLRQMVGMFSGILPFKGSYNSDKLLSDLLTDIANSQRTDYRHQHYQVGDLSRYLKINPTESYLYDVVVSYEPFDFELDFGDELQASVVQIRNENIRNPLEIIWQDYDKHRGLHLQINYSNEYFSQEEVVLFVKRLLFIIEQFPDAINQPLDELNILPTEEKTLITEKFNETGIEYARDKSVTELIAEQAKLHPELTAVEFKEETISYRELNARSNQVARYLQEKGVKPGSIVPICIERGPEMLYGILGILKAGAAYVPIDPDHPVDRISFMLEDIGATLIVSSTTGKAKLTGTMATVIELDGQWEAISKQPIDNPAHQPSGNELAYIIYTSGSTGKPKGVMIEHHSLVNLLQSIVKEVEFTPNSGFLSVTTYSFDICYLELYVPLITGGRLIIVPGETAGDGYLLAKSIDRYKPTHIQGTPSTWQLLLDAEWQNKEKIRMLIGGEVVKESIKNELTGIGDVWNVYGPTETTIWSTIKKLSATEKVLIGKPLANTELYILNSTGALCPVGVPGEICIAGEGLARGYFKRPELTAEKFIPNPFSTKPGSRLYKTGDVGRWQLDGNMEHQGRMDDQVKIRGYRIELGEIESVMAGSGLVRQAVVIPKEDSLGNLRLVGYVIPDEKIIRKREHELYQQQVRTWQDLYETEYKQAEINDTGIDEEFNIGIWNDSFTGEAIAEEQMKQWLDDIVSVINPETSRSILEIGCGTGLIFYQLAGKVQQYYGTDLSQSSVNRIHTRVSKKGREYGPAEFWASAAHEISVKPGTPVDTIVLNSVAQYFPGEGYMNEALDRCISVLNGKGRIVIGDIRDNRLLELFKGRILLQKLQANLSLPELTWTAEQDVLKEEELCFSPDYFYNLQQQYPQITHIEIFWKQGSYINELTQYRYTVVLHVGIDKVVFDPQWQNWSEQNQQNLIAEIEENQPVIALKNVPNPRLWKENLLHKAFYNKAVSNLGHLSAIIEKEDKETLSIREMLQKAEQQGYHCRLFVNEDPLLVNILLEKDPTEDFILNANADKNTKANEALTNIPLYTTIFSALKKDIISALQIHLPVYMIPQELNAIKQLPLTNNGKVDRRFLSQRNDSLVGKPLSFTAPRTETEEKLVSIWQTLLGLERVGIHDNFFELGGHSLLGMRLVAAIRKQFEVELGIKEVFVYPTISELSLHIEGQSKGLSLPPIQAVIPRPKEIPLSFSQERLWFIDQLEGSIQYHMSTSFRYKGPLDKKALFYALETIISRHEILRTVIKEIDGRVCQLLLETGNWKLTETNGARFRKDAGSLKDYIRRFVREPFDLSRDYMFRANLIDFGGQEYLLVLNMHHIAMDGWSTSILLKEVMELYNARIENREPNLAVLPLQYADYALWQRQHQTEAAMEKKVAYWKQQLNGVTPLQLPADFPRSVKQGSEGASTNFQIDLKLLNQLRELNRAHEVTLFMTLLAAFKILLYKYSGQNDICIGTPVAGRNQQEIEGLAGFFVNTLALRTEINGAASFENILQDVKSTTLEAYGNQEVSFEKVVEVAVKTRDLNNKALVQVIFILHNTLEKPEVKFGEIDVKEETIEEYTAPLELVFHLTEESDGLSGFMQYSTELFKRETIDSFLAHYTELLASVVVRPTIPVDELNILPTEEKTLITEKFNDTGIEYARDKSVTELIAEQAKLHPELTAVEFKEETISYRELNARSNQVARYLQEKGVKPGSIVPICIERGPEMLYGILGILKAGAAYVPIDPDHPVDRISFMLEDIGATLIVSSTTGKAKLTGTMATVIELDGQWEAISKQPIDNPAHQPSGNELAYIIYTSGSTGKPKGVMIEHHSLVNLLQSIVKEVEFTPNSGFLSVTTYSFDICYLELYVPLITGGRLIIVPGETAGDGYLLAKSIDRYKPTHIQGTPSTWQLLLDAEWQNKEKIRMLIGGEVVKESIKNELTGIGDVWNVYGPTETTIWSTIKKLSATEKVLIGKPLANTELYILNSTGALCPVGVPGEICIAGEGLARGYFKRPELTAEKFIPNPFSTKPGSRLYKTGDVGRWQLDGNMEHQGRMDDQVKIRGYRIELGEIESVMAGSGLVRQAVVIPKEDSLGNLRLVGYVIPDEKGHKAFGREAMQAYLNLKLPEYMVPKVWVALESLPLTPNGKTDRKALPDPEQEDLSNTLYVAPRTEMEAKLAVIWQELLGLEHIGIHENFFELGGHSLLGMSLVAAVRKQFDVELTIRDLFVNPSIAELSGFLINANKNISKFLIPLQISGDKQPLYIVCGGGGSVYTFRNFVDMLDPDQPVYGLQHPVSHNELSGFPETIEGIAEKYISEIRVDNPDGPYNLSGHCLGGTIAFEMARQLQAMGKEVSTLVMFDTTVAEKQVEISPSFSNFYNMPAIAKKSLSLALLKFRFELFLLLHHPRQALSYKLDKAKEFVGQNMPKPEDMEVFEKMLTLFQKASDNYQIKPYNGMLLVFYAKEHYFFMDRENKVVYKKISYSTETKNAWGKYASSVLIHEVEGEHSAMFDLEYAGELARLLQQQLNEKNGVDKIALLQ